MQKFIRFKKKKHTEISKFLGGRHRGFKSGCPDPRDPPSVTTLRADPGGKRSRDPETLKPEFITTPNSLKKNKK